MINDKKCSLLWNHTCMCVDGNVLPCNRFDISKTQKKIPHITDGINSAFNSELFEDVRTRMLAGEYIPECHRCIKDEEAGGNSLRLQMNEKFTTLDKKLKYIETAFSTHCNLSCRMCNEKFSSKWKLINNPGMSAETSIDNFNLDYYDADLSNLRLIKLVGGEPMIDKKHVDFLEMLFEKSDNPDEITLYYNTNGTVKPSDKVIKFWEKVKRVVVVFSIDGIGEVNETIRPPHKWEIIDKNIRYFSSLRNINFYFRIHTVISVLNVKHLHDIVNYSQSFFGDGPEIDLLDFPEHLSLRNINYKDEILNYIKCYRNVLDVTDKSIYEYIKNFIDSAPDDTYSKQDIIEKENRLTKVLKTKSIGELL